MKQKSTEIREFLSSPYFPYIAGATALGLCAAVPAAAAWLFLHPPRAFNRTNPRAGRGLPYDRVRFTSADGTRIRAWHIPAPTETRPRGIVIVCHGYTGNRATMLPYADFLHHAGYVTLLPEFRAHGWSGGSRISFGIGESLDLRAAIEWVQGHEELRHLPLILLGESMGAAVVLLVAAEIPGVCAVIADSPYARFDIAVEGRFITMMGEKVGPRVAPFVRRIGERMLGIRSEDIAPELVVGRVAPRPVLLIQGLADRLIHPRNAHRILNAAPGNVTLWEVPDADHVMSVYLVKEEYARRVLAFLDDVLGDSSAECSCPPEPGDRDEIQISETARSIMLRATD
ncbi:MAG: alpha/beta hydrolase [Capsulimonadales bacterium]|nr:alpha/beta hydrolase [Capsulimonadales bacterium]